ncbi:MAG: protein translocase subunit SecF [Deltaproteobacteria bacterium]|jgi:preprotein translocase subunit SecF|nr:protein translocase subunit SecF [Deltaproteobacteria bacterium]
MGLHFIPSEPRIDFVGLRKISYVLSILLLLAGLCALMFRGGLRYGIDFSGGVTVQIRFQDALPDEEIKASLAGTALPGLAVQQYGDDGRTYLLRVSALEESSSSVATLVKDALEASLAGQSYEVQRLEMVGPKVGADLRGQALEALYFAILLVSVYISGRFEHRWFTAAFMAGGIGLSLYLLGLAGVSKIFLIPLAVILMLFLCWKLKLIFALGATVSMLHDVLISIGFFALLDKEFDLTIIAALLTIIGYSLNDTIIVYDRIRENLRGDFSTPLGMIINRSINQTLSRTILTSGTTLFVITSLLLLGGGIIHDFALMMFIGVFVGTASSIFVASPILLAFGSAISRTPPKKEDRRPRDSDGRLAPQV